MDPASATPGATLAAEDGPPLVVVRRQFPRIASAVELMWGDRALDGYLQKLILSDRGDRDGFPKDVLAALLKLYDQHNDRFHFQAPEDSQAFEDNWSQEDRIDRVQFRPGRG